MSMVSVTQSRAISSRHRRWLALFICLTTLSLVAHLINRFADRPGFKTTTVRCGCHEGWQYLERDALDWAAPPQTVAPLAQLTVRRHAALPEDVQLPQVLPNASLFCRPPPSC